MRGSSRLVLTAVCVSIGVLLAVQIRSTGNLTSTVPDLRTSEMRVMLMDAIRQNQTLQEVLEELRRKVRDYELSLTQGEGALGLLRTELDRARLLAGITAVSGPGLVITLSDSKKPPVHGDDPRLFIIHDEDILKLVNVLRAAGAEALSVNGERLLASSEIHCAGPVISINNVRVASPFVISAIGNAAAMESSLRMRGGIVETLGYFGMEIAITRHSTLEVPGFTRPLRFEWARPIEGR
ncbi:MAG: hypothetical protein DDT37_00157 [Firmicutes bacterium]|nr:hypothetical protein [candidate division NPL-UPA2 bacterium]